MNKVMGIWAKISSWGILLIYLLSFLYSFYLYNTQTIHKILYMADPSLRIIPALILLVILCPPLFYFAWDKKKKSEEMKIWAKVITILYPIYFILTGVIIFPALYSILSLAKISLFPSIIPDLIILISVIPLYYYGWRKLKR